MFWVYGFPVWRDYGYTDKQNDEGGYPSGQFGSGVAIITLILAIVCTLIYLSQILEYVNREEEDDEEKDKDA